MVGTAFWTMKVWLVMAGRTPPRLAARAKIAAVKAGLRAKFAEHGYDRILIEADAGKAGHRKADTNIDERQASDHIAKITERRKEGLGNGDAKKEDEKGSNTANQRRLKQAFWLEAGPAGRSVRLTRVVEYQRGADSPNRKQAQYIEDEEIRNGLVAE